MFTAKPTKPQTVLNYTVETKIIHGQEVQVKVYETRQTHNSKSIKAKRSKSRKGIMG